MEHSSRLTLQPLAWQTLNFSTVQLEARRAETVLYLNSLVSEPHFTMQVARIEDFRDGRG